MKGGNSFLESLEDLKIGAAPARRDRANGSSPHKSSRESGADYSTPSPGSGSPFLAPPSTPSPQYGFRRNTANVMQTGRRVRSNSDRGASAPSNTRNGTSGSKASGWSGGRAEEDLLPSTRTTRQRLYDDGRRGDGNDRVREALALASRNQLEGRAESVPSFSEEDREGGGAHYVRLSPGRIRSASLPMSMDRSTSSDGGSRPAGSVPVARERLNLESLPRDQSGAVRGAGAALQRPASAPAPPSASGISSLDEVPQLVPGISAVQQRRFTSLQSESTEGYQLAQGRTLEMMQYWMSMPSTRNLIESTIQEALVEAGIAKARQAWAGDEANSPAPTPLAKEKTQRKSPTGASDEGMPSTVPEAAAPPASGAAAPPSAVAEVAKSGLRKHCKPSEMNDAGSSSGEVTGPSENGTATPSSSPQRGDVPVGVRPASPSADPVKGSQPFSNVYPPPSKPPASDSALSLGKGGDDGDGGELGVSTPRRSPKPSISFTSPRPHSGGNASKAAPPASSTASTPRGRGSNPSSSPPPPSLHLPTPGDVSLSSSARHRQTGDTAVRHATYDEIPRFYFPLGRPSSRERAITGPLSSKNENPHLKIAEGVTLPAPMYDGGETFNGGANAEVAGAGAEPQLASRTSRLAPMSTLRAVDDRQVGHYIQREYARLPPFPKHTGSKVRLLSGRLRGSGSHHNISFAKQEATYRQQFTLCIQRICNQCFGLPRYFAFLVMRLIQAEVSSSGGGSGSVPGSRAGGRMGSSSAILGQAPPAPQQLPMLLITAQHMKDFYDRHLKNKNSIRRIFDLLILSSRLESSVPNSATEAAQQQQQPLSPTPLYDGDGIEQLRPYLLPHDFVAYMETLLTHHPGLVFLRQTPDFQSKYLDTVIYRIFYELDRFDRGRIQFSEFNNSRLVDALRQVDATEDINTVLLFFSYEHFYVLYCRFWELDTNRDMLLSKEDFIHYSPDDVMNPVIVDRVFAGVGRCRRCTVADCIGYEDFVWFCLSEEDKSTPPAIRYWFRILDLDGDGVLSVYELRHFYDATRGKIAEYITEGLVSFDDVMCQIFDMLRCSTAIGLRLSDFMREPEAASVAMNMCCNVVKFLQFEQRDPFVSHQERLMGGLEQSAWDRFARAEYDRMALEADEEE